eukprot:CAMPEP_0196741602 /NCGR_PEP_ID=MMETSP1091-20130531/41343_1 /TAXON_ID=302021 /ORGANISM="Rhodomonas sp., Strain CCMP768" /LENGTH=142 /DNA_ID=CAMNT_0042087363 /DNA_START=24 /DNA_END=452 /DNA_ORIENTATION=+
MYIVGNFASPQASLAYPKQSFASPPPMLRAPSRASPSPMLRTPSLNSASPIPQSSGFNYRGERRLDDEYVVEVQLPATPVPPTMMVPMQQPDGSVQYVRAVHKGWSYERTAHPRSNPHVRPIIVQDVNSSGSEEGRSVVMMC